MFSLRRRVGYGSLIGVGVILALGGILTVSLVPEIFEWVFRRVMSLSQNSRSYEMWKVLPVPLRMKAYIFNVENPLEVSKGLASPRIKEVGPFVFREFRDKEDIVWNEANGTVSYSVKRHWKFEPQESLPLNKVIRILNVPAAAATKTFAGLSPFIQGLISINLKIIGEKLFVEKTAEEILFQGYEDPLLKEASEFHLMPALEKFGIFYKRNNSKEFDGVTNIYTGALGVDKFGEIARWNFKSSNGYFPQQCGEVKGGLDFLPPMDYNTQSIYMYSTDMCRPLKFDIRDRKSLSDLKVHTYTYELSDNFYSNSSQSPSNICFEEGHPLPSGVFNSSACRLESPVFISNPHFLNADPIYSEQFQPGSMRPNFKNHNSWIKIEPISGLITNVRIKSQFNIFLRNIGHIDMFKNVNDTFFPVAWFDYSMDMTPKISTEIWEFSLIPLFVKLFALVILALAIGLIVVTLLILKAEAVAERRKEEVSPILRAEITEDEDEETLPNP